MKDDIAKTLIAKSDQLNAADLISGAITVEVLGVKVTRSEQPVSIDIGGDYQVYKPCKSMRRLLASVWGTSSEEWVGHSMTLYCDPDVTWAGIRTGGIRVSHVSGISKDVEIPLRSSKHKVIVYTVSPIFAPYSDEDIENNKEAWRSSFNEKNTPEKLIAKIKTKYTLTKNQEEAILSFGAK